MTPAKVSEIGGQGDVVGGTGVTRDRDSLDCAIPAGRDSIDTFHVHQHCNGWKVPKEDDEECTKEKDAVIVGIMSRDPLGKLKEFLM